MARAARGVVVAAVVGLCLAAAAGAQELQMLEKTTPQQRADIQTAFMAKKLGLSPEVRTKVAAINLKYAQQAQPILTGSEGPLRKMHDMKDVESQKENELKGVLTPQQFQQLLASKEELRAHLTKELSGRGGAAAP